MVEENFSDIAAEYVLGTLEAEERRAFLRRLAREPLLVEAVKDWQERLAPLALALDPVAPPAELYDRIEGSIAQVPVALQAVPPEVAAPVAANDNRVVRWRLATMAAALVAVIAAGLALRPGEVPVAPAPQAPIQVQPVSLTTAVAALSPSGGTPGLFVTYDKVTRRLKVVPVNVPADAQHSFELWVIRGKDKPKPAGLIDSARAVQAAQLEHTGEDVTLAVSQEPIGGSPTGQPTGPVLYSGKLVTLPTT